MRRAETARAKEAQEMPKTLGEVDFLLGVNDEARQGALRFSHTPDEPFLALKSKKTIPPLVELPRLLSATERFLDDEENAQDLQLLLAPGSSLGGARPKASIIDTDGNLAIAKFSRKDDDFNVVTWEAVTLVLAKKARLTLPSWRLDTILEKPVLIIRRFDRMDETRIPFLSAMSMLGTKDGEVHSYLEIVDALKQHGAAPNADMAELWRRIVFSIMVSNVDDHLRNHGFVYKRQKGWRLSPAYDINPTPVEVKPRVLTTMIDLYDGTASLDLAMSVANDFRLSLIQAKTIVHEIATSVSQWRNVAQAHNLGKREVDRVASAFEHDDFKKVKKL
jgi:serine/threonine-protein kinase HipA